MKFLTLFIAFFVVAYDVNAQTVFQIEDRITSGPFVELQDGEVTVYTWVKKNGVLAKKMGNSYNGRTEVKVRTLMIHKFDASGKLVEELAIPSEVDDREISGMGSYIVCPEGGKTSICTEKNAFAKKGDPDVREIMENYPRSSGKKTVETREEFVSTFSGSGLLSNKLPYTVKVDKKAFYGGQSKVLDSQEAEVKDFVTDDDNSEWKVEWELEESKQFNPNNGHSYQVYRKSVKKDKTKKFNYLRERKLVSFNDKGEMISEKDMTSDKLKFSHQNTMIFDKNGQVSGFAIVYIDAWGMGYKKSNPGLDRQDAKVVLLDAEAKYVGEADIRYPVDMGLLDVIYVPLIMQTDEGYIIYLNVQGKKKADQKAAIKSFIYKNGEVTEGIEKTIAEMKMNADGEKSVLQIFNSREVNELVRLSDGGLITSRVYSKEIIKNDKKVMTYPGTTYMLLDKNQQLMHIGNIPSSGNNLAVKPEVSIDQVADNKIIYSLKGKRSSTIYVLNTADYVWEKLEATAKDHTVYTAQVEDNNLYLFSTSDADPSYFRIDKMTF